MIFYIEEESDERSIYSYQSSCIFDELLEFYAFLNVWAVRDDKARREDDEDNPISEHEARSI